VRGRGGRLAAAGLLTVVAVGCGIVELEAEEDPDGLDPVEEPLGTDDDPTHPADDDLDNAEGTD
jgi:hypothetical protein